MGYNCNGCTIHNDPTPYEKCMYEKWKKNCPCRECLVKVTCGRKSSCNPFLNFINTGNAVWTTLAEVRIEFLDRVSG